jgi:hypothetical protein
MSEPLSRWEQDRQAGRDVLAQLGTPGLRYTLRIEMRTPVSRGTRSDEALIDSRELDEDTTAVLVGRVGYDALNRDLPASSDPVDALLQLAAALRDPDLVQAAVWADQFTGSRVTLSVVARHPDLPGASLDDQQPPTPTEPMTEPGP